MKKFFLMLVILFLCGMISADVCIDIIKDSSVLMDLEIYKNYAGSELIYRNVLWNILYERLKLFGFLLLLCFTPFRRFLNILIVSIFSFIWGFFMMSSIAELGLAGVVVGIAAVLPHGILYGALVMMLLSQKSIHSYHRGERIAVNIMTVVIMILLFLTGCVMESFVGTHFIPWVIRLSLI